MKMAAIIKEVVDVAKTDTKTFLGPTVPLSLWKTMTRESHIVIAQNPESLCLHGLDLCNIGNIIDEGRQFCTLFLTGKMADHGRRSRREQIHPPGGRPAGDVLVVTLTTTPIREREMTSEIFRLGRIPLNTFLKLTLFAGSLLLGHHRQCFMKQ